MKRWIFCVLPPLAVGGISGFLIRNQVQVYSSLQQPPFAPPSWLFPVAWTILYLLMGTAYCLMEDTKAPPMQKRKAKQAYWIQLGLNFFWPIWFFSFQQYWAAFFWLVLLVGVIVVTAVRFFQIRPLAGWLLAPYIVWTVFAGYLNFYIARWNG